MVGPLSTIPTTTDPNAEHTLRLRWHPCPFVNQLAKIQTQHQLANNPIRGSHHRNNLLLVELSILNSATDSRHLDQQPTLSPNDVHDTAALRRRLRLPLPHRRHRSTSHKQPYEDSDDSNLLFHLQDKEEIGGPNG